MKDTMHYRITMFQNLLQERMDTYYAEQFQGRIGIPQISLMAGKRYVRVVESMVVGTVLTQKSVHCFIDTTNGDVLKAAGWKAPAKHARGNIFNEDVGMNGVGIYGANYLR